MKSAMSSHEPNTKRLQLIMYIKKNMADAGDALEMPNEAVFKRVDMGNRKDGTLMFDQSLYKKNKIKKDSKKLKKRRDSAPSESSCDSNLSDDALIN